MGRTQNLKPWQKGMSGNPGGRPKKTPLSDACRELLNMPAPRGRTGRTYAEAIAERLAKKALAGNIYAARELADRAEGKARQAMELSGPEGGPLDVRNMTDEELDKRHEELRAKVIEGLTDTEIKAELERRFVSCAQRSQLRGSGCRDGERNPKSI